MIRGPAGESTPVGDPTIPVPAGGPAGAATRQPGYQVPAGYRPRSRRGWRILRRTAVLFMTLVLLALVAFGALLVVTPSVSNAPRLARAQARAHHAVYPGPQIPARLRATSQMGVV